MNQQNFKTEPTEEAGEVAEWEVTGMLSFLRARGFEWEAALLTRLQKDKEELERKVEYGATVVADMTKHGASLLAVERKRAEAAERELAAVQLQVKLLMDTESEVYAARAEVWRVKAELAAVRKDAERCRLLLANLYAVVKGECPSLLNEDSGGDADLDSAISAALQQDTKEGK